MALEKAQCTNCGGLLEVDQSKDAAICPFCNTPYIVEKAINLYKTEIIANGSTINISQTALDADTMFENWLVNRNPKLEEDLRYYYAADPRNEYIEICKSLKTDLFAVGKNGVDRAIDLANIILSNQRFSKYKEKELSVLNGYQMQIDGYRRRLHNQRIDSIINGYKKKAVIFVLASLLLSIAVVISFIVSHSRADMGSGKRVREYSFFIMDVRSGQVEEVLWNYENNRLLVRMSEDRNYQGAHSYCTYTTDTKEALADFFEKYDVEYSSITLSPVTKRILIISTIISWIASLSFVFLMNHRIHKLSNQKE